MLFELLGTLAYPLATLRKLMLQTLVAEVSAYAARHSELPD